MTTTNTRVLRDQTPSDQEGITELPDAATAADMALLQAVRSGTKVIRKSTGRPVTVEELEEELAASSANKTPTPKKPGNKKATPANSKYDDMDRNALVKSLKNAQQKIGEQGQEVGQLRNLTDKLLDLKRTDDLTAHGASLEDSPISGDTLLTNPRDTINQVVDDNPRLTAIEDKLSAIGQSTIESQFAAAHPEYKDDMSTPVFQEWVKASPYRSTLAAKALEKQDWDAAHELFTAYDEVRDSLTQEDDAAGGDDGQGNTVVPVDVSRNDALAAAQMVAGGGSGGAANTKPIYSRQALINKRIQDPTGYYDQAFQDIIKEAYVEGRVK